MVQLDSGAASQITTNTGVLQTCRTTPLATASQITLEAADPAQFVSIDSTLSAVKVQKGDSVPIRISTKDAQGNFVGNTPFALKHANSINRQNVSSSQKVSVTTAAGTTVDTSATTTLYGVTGPDGTTTMTLRQDASTGLRTDFYALLNDTGVSSDTFAGDLYRHHQPGYTAGGQLGPYGGNLYQQRRRHLQAAFPQS